MKDYLDGKQRPPILEFLDIEVIALEPGSARLRLAARAELANAMGTLHGGVLCDLGDAAMGYALAATLGPNESFATVELSIRYFKSVRDSVLEARARVVNRSKRLTYLECDIFNDQDELVARLASTCMFR